MKTKTQHMPGPWIVQKSFGNGPSTRYRVVAPLLTPILIADALTKGDAVLIAAVPNLLEAAKTALFQMEKVYGPQRIGDFEAAKFKLEAAIAQAEEKE